MGIDGGLVGSCPRGRSAAGEAAGRQPRSAPGKRPTTSTLSALTLITSRSGACDRERGLPRGSPLRHAAVSCILVPNSSDFPSHTTSWPLLDRRQRAILGSCASSTPAGPVIPEMHYHIPPLARLDVDDLLLLIRQWKYFVLHAPPADGEDVRASGTERRAELRRRVPLRLRQRRGCQSAREDVGAAIRAILSALARAARETLGDLFVAEVWPDILEAAGPHDALRETLARWAEADASRWCS